MDLETLMAAERAKAKAKRDAAGDFSSGGILRQKCGERWAFILPDVGEPGCWRIQYFDLRGFSGHGVYRTAEEAIESALSCGYVGRDDDALDRVQGLPSFVRGNEVADIIRRINSGEITHNKGDELIEAYDRRHPNGVGEVLSA